LKIEGSGYKSLDEGAKVQFETEPGQKGLQATGVRVVGATRQEESPAIDDDVTEPEAADAE
jgi:'Cold-shock' DNA-binding domain